MENASSEYKEAMQENLRGTSYVWISLGLINTYAQESAYISSTFTGSESSIYSDSAMGNGVVSTMNDGSMTFTFGEYTDLNLSGVSLNLNKPLPETVTVTNGSVSKTAEVKPNGKVVVEKLFNGCSYVTVTPDTGKLRVKKVNFGIKIDFENKDIMSTARRNTVNHLNSELPVKEFSFTVHNYDRLWNQDNPFSYSLYLQEKQVCTYKYGRELQNGDIYIIEGGKVYLMAWSSDDYQARFTCVGLLDYLDSTYNKGAFYSNGRTLYDLAKDVMIDAGIENYEIDNCLKKIKTNNPLPMDTHKACLQLIANAGKCLLFENRQGAVCLRSADIPAVIKTGYVYNATNFSSGNDVVNVVNNNNYGATEPGYTFADGARLFYPISASTVPVGLVSEEYANAQGTFTNNPSVEVRFQSEVVLFEISLLCPVAAQDFTIQVFINDTVLDTKNVTGNTMSSYFESYDGLLCNKVIVTFTKTTPYQRIHLNNIDFDAEMDYTITYHDLTATPVAKLIDKVSDLNINLYTYKEMSDIARNTALGQPSVDYVELPSGGLEAVINMGTDALVGIEVKQGVNVIELPSASTVSSVVYDDEGGAGTCTIVEKGAYYVKVNCSRDGYVIVKGTEYMENKSQYTVHLNDIGNPVTVNNPLISTKEQAQMLEPWFREYYENDVEYRLTYRGDPVLDCDDCVFLENKFVTKNLVRIESEELTTSAGMNVNNSLTARRVSYEV